MSIGIIGVGNIGLAVAKTLSRAGIAATIANSQGREAIQDRFSAPLFLWLPRASRGPPRTFRDSKQLCVIAVAAARKAQDRFSAPLFLWVPRASRGPPTRYPVVRSQHPPFPPRRAALTAESAAGCVHFRHTSRSRDINAIGNASGDSPSERLFLQKEISKMAFPRCVRCGKAIAVGVACLCAFATIHPTTDHCGDWDTGPDHRAVAAMYCNRFVAEPVHGPHQDHPRPAERATVVVASTSSSGMSGLFPGSQR
jgi:NADP oxidoreductase coenzyme F420-dependent